MNSDVEMLAILKFVCGETDHICRLCFASTENKKNAIEDAIKLQRHYFDDTLSYLDMFDELGISAEPLLPQELCTACANTIISSFLLKKLCQHSNDKWNQVLEKLNQSLIQSEAIHFNFHTAYLMINDHENIIATSRKSHPVRSKKEALNKIRGVTKSRRKYVRIKQGRSELKLICEECGERFSSKYLLAKHMNKHSNTKVPCKQCAKVFTTPLQIEEHAERVHYPKKLKCPKCTKMFSTDRLLRLHDSLHHKATICKLCFVQFPSKQALTSHLNKHETNKCPHCSKTFMNKLSFKSHLKICGNLEEKGPHFFCDICKKGYARKNGLQTHLRTDHGFGNVISCNWCGKKFDAVSKLKNHIVTHTKEKKFHCEQCGGKFVTQAALVYHVRLHTGERPFPCDLCDESFLSASRRMEHKRRKHFGPSKECPVCHAKFVTGHQLRKHVQRHFNPHSKLYVPDAEDHTQVPVDTILNTTNCFS